LKYGVTSNLLLDATLNPDFSQVEADAGQISVNERFALFFPERRPFFLEGAALFTTPEPLVYTRTIVSPVGGAKLTGRAGGLNLGFLGAVDDAPLSGGVLSFAPSPARATFGIARVQRDVGAGSTVGLVATDREAGDEWNRVAGVDGRIRFGGVYSWIFQGAGSWTRAWTPTAGALDSAQVGGRQVAVAPETLAGHLVHTAFDRSGRGWGFLLQAKDIPHDFRAESGFVRRVGVTDFFAVNRLSWFGTPGALLENGTLWMSGNRIYERRGFWEGEAPAEGSAGARGSFALRGNNRLEASYSNRFFTLDPARYAGYAFRDAEGNVRSGLDAVEPVRELRGLQGVGLQASSSYFKTVSGRVETRWEETPIFAEGTRGREWSLEAGVGARPTDALRAEGSVRRSRITRASDGSLYSEAVLPRLRVEYQLSRHLFVRAVGQYAVEETDLLRTPDGTPYLRAGAPFRIRRGTVSAEGVEQSNPLRTELLLSYQPSPGTVVFVGYGREMNDTRAWEFGALEPRADGLFLKVSYLFRR
ncbi:MAG: DUF5916 domain-containing protein, partial [Gemmatimonadota bacterium]|nr:DUF5916 domain-containing protein [Gemmatimonadota bacterium]